MSTKNPKTHEESQKGRIPREIILSPLEGGEHQKHVLVADVGGKGSYKKADQKGNPDRYVVIDFNQLVPEVLTPQGLCVVF